MRTPLFNQVGKLRTSSHLQLQPGQDKAKQFDTYNRRYQPGYFTSPVSKNTVQPVMLDNNNTYSRKLLSQSTNMALN